MQPICLCRTALTACLGLPLQSTAFAGGDLCPPNSGPDVIVSDLFDIGGFGVADDIGGYAIATVSCNIGDEVVLWNAVTNQHPVIAQNMYRLLDGRFEQIGQSWAKHGFSAMLDTCCICQEPDDAQVLGVGCSDPYSVDLNGDQGGFYGIAGLGPRSDVNPVTGGFSFPYPTQGRTGDAAYKRLQIHNDDLDPALNPGARYFGEGHYVTPTDAVAGNQNNNASYCEVTVGALGRSGYELDFLGDTAPMSPGIQAWQDVEPGVSIETVEVDGILMIGAHCTDNEDGTWHYEYAVYNMNSDRSGQSFSVPVPTGATVTNIGFHDVDSHSGEPYDTTDWSHQLAGGALTWSTTDFDIDPNANALRWGTLYSFRFDSDAPPQPVDATLGLFKPGTPGSVTASVCGPVDGTPGDVNGDGMVDVSDLLIVLGNWGPCPDPCPPQCPGDDVPNCVVDVADLLSVLANWS